jgi:SpoVK/Ycf46/Vps4 family AAA+-type ATPase
MGSIGIITVSFFVFLLAVFVFNKLKEQKRLKNSENDLITEIIEEDKKQEYDQTILDEALQRLNALEGLDTLKMEVSELVKLIRYDMEEGQFDHRNAAMHMAFLGNPGTGKTTVARIIADIYKGLGVLDNGHLVEVDRSGLVGQFIGHTAAQTKTKIEEAFGGILFIDEAYNLVDRGKSDFGLEAIDTLLKMMEDHRGKFIVIVAGYEQLMLDFLASNPGLTSRFDKILYFQDHSDQELWTVCISQLKQFGKELDNEAADIVKKYINHISEKRTAGFGNSREIRKIVNEIIKNQKIRLSDTPITDRTDNMRSLIIETDVKEFADIEVKYQKQIGYKLSTER